jgi:hypothetical protein
VKHAGSAALRTIEGDLLPAIRARPELVERTPRIFYRKSVAFLHFHEDPAGLFADLKLGKGFTRFPVNTKEERRALLNHITKALSS